MKYLGLASVLLLCVLVFGQTVYGQCSGGKINGIYHTSCYPWDNGSPNFDGYIPGTSTKNDTGRLRRAVTAAFGKLVFDERDYFINDEITVYSYRILEGTGRGTYFDPPTPSPLPSPTPTPAIYESHYTSKIIQTADDKAIFRIGEGTVAVSIRDLAMTSGLGAENTVGILMEGGAIDNYSALYFQFSNLTFNSLGKGLYVNALDDPKTGGDQTGVWQADNIRVDHCAFEYCTIGMHINSFNAGMNVTSIDFIVPGGDVLDEKDPLSAGQTYGVFLERSTYMNMDLLIGNGSPGGPATAFVYVKGHGNLSIRNIIDEGFRNSIFIEARIGPIPFF